MSFPWADWQFYCVTLAAAWGLWIVVRQLVPTKKGQACTSCATGAAARAKPKSSAESVGLVTLGDRG